MSLHRVLRIVNYFLFTFGPPFNLYSGIFKLVKAYTVKWLMSDSCRSGGTRMETKAKTLRPQSVV